MKKIRIGLIGLIISLVFMAGSAFAEDMIQIKGSDTLSNVVQSLSEVYMNKYPGRYIAVTGGGSGTGVAALINKNCDIANSSRSMKSSEIAQASDKGVQVNRVVIGMDGLSVITNGNNLVSQLTVDQIGKIFRGEITNWKDVGGQDMAITLYGRQSNSGTFSFFRDSILKSDYSQKMNRMNGNAQIVEAIKQDRSGIGFVGVGYAKKATGINVLKVAIRAGGTYASPLNSADVNSGKYPIARPLNQYVNGTPEGAIKHFLAFELSAEGQKIVESQGFFSIPNEYKELNAKIGL